VARQRHEALYPESITEVFRALVRTLALRRWSAGAVTEDLESLPRAGCRYCRQTSTALRTGIVLEVIRPVSITLCETLDDPPCRVELKLRWRLHPTEAGSLLKLELQYRLNHAATLRRRHWHGQLARHCAKLFRFVRRDLDWQQRQAAANSNS